uniref:Prefoldin subunit 1 n=15 Tax=Passeriformes TaxID=9126 RepID=A0A8C3ETK0_CORMO
MRPAPTRWRRPWTWSSRRYETPARVFLFHVCSLLVSHPSTVCPAPSVYPHLCSLPCPGVAGRSPRARSPGPVVPPPPLTPAFFPGQAFTELQAKVMDTQQKVKLADLQIEQLTKTKKHAHLTDTEVMMLVDETRMYEGVGRMFILQPKGVIHNQLLEKQRIAEEKIKELEQKKSYLERSVKEAEDNIREMLMARRAQ